MKMPDLRQLDWNNIGGWPLPIKIGMLSCVFLIILAAAYWFDWSDQWEELQKSRQQEEMLKGTFKEKKRMAINLDAYKKRKIELEQSFGALLKQLPNKSEMDALITDINQAGLGRGLQFELFKPAAQESRSEFYAELPVMIRVTGGYHDLGAFASDVGKLSRIVLLQDLSIQPTTKDKDSSLTMDAVAKTYRYLDDQEIAQQQKTAKAAKEKELKK